MNYRRIYNNLVDRAVDRNIDGYTERHHIIPTCLGGADDKDNIVELTAREHFLAHWLLYRIYPNNSSIAYAFHIMCYDKHGNRFSNFTPSSRMVGEAREAQASARTGSYHSQETKEKISKGVQLAYSEGRINRDYTITQIQKQRMSEAKLGKDRPDKDKQAISEGRTGVATGSAHWAYGGWSIERKEAHQAKINHTYNNKEQIYNKAKRLYDDGMPMTHISNEVSVSRQTLYNWKNKYNWVR